MRRILQILALSLALISTLFWVSAGAHRGWSKTSVPVKSVDEVTGIEAIAYERRFVPGLDFLGGTWLGAVALAGAALMFRRKTND